MRCSSMPCLSPVQDALGTPGNLGAGHGVALGMAAHSLGAGDLARGRQLADARHRPRRDPNQSPVTFR